MKQVYLPVSADHIRVVQVLYCGQNLSQEWRSNYANDIFQLNPLFMNFLMYHTLFFTILYAKYSYID